MISIFLFCSTLLVLGNAQVTCAKSKINIMPLGNSITGSFDKSSSYRYWTWSRLKSAGLEVHVDFVGYLCGVGDNGDPDDCGDPSFDCEEWDCDHEGWHNTYIRALAGKFSSSIRRGTPVPDVVLIHQGTNDVASGNDPAVMKGQMGIAIDTIRTYNPKAVILLAQIIPTNEPHNPELVPVYNDSLKSLAVEKNRPESPIVLVDQYSAFDPRWILADGLHPNAAGEQFIGYTFGDSLLSILEDLFATESEIICPVPYSWIELGDTVAIRARGGSFFGVDSLFYYENNIRIASRAGEDYNAKIHYWEPSFPGVHKLGVIVKDSAGRYDTSDIVRVNVIDSDTLFPCKIGTIQGQFYRSRYDGRRVRTSGIVTATAFVRNEFWMECGQGDGSSLTSDGIYVDLSGSPEIAVPNTGDSIIVVGMVEELGQWPENPLTSIRNVEQLSVLYSGASLPAPLSVDVLPGKAGQVSSLAERYEVFEGMRVTLAEGVAVAPSDTSGVFAFVLNRNLVRVPYVIENENGKVNYGPQVVLVDGRLWETPPTIRVGDTIQSFEAVIDYRNGIYVFQALPGQPVITPGDIASSPAPVSRRLGIAGSTTLTTMDFGSFYDTIDNHSRLDTVISPYDFEVRCEKAVRAIVDELQLPKLLILQGIETSDVPGEIAARVNSAEHSGYKALFDSTDSPDGLGCAFLYDSSFWSSADAYFMAGIAVDSSFGALSGNPTGAPLIGEFYYSPTRKITVVNCNLVSRRASPLFGTIYPPLRENVKHRANQAGVIRDWIDSIYSVDSDCEVIVAGQTNDLPFGTWDENLDNALSIIKGPDGSVSRLVSVYDSLPAFARFTRIEDGRAWMSHHILLSESLADRVLSCNPLHFNTLYEDAFGGDNTTAIRVSKYDALEIRFH